MHTVLEYCTHFQVLSRLFATHIVTDFEVGSNPYTKYRALNLHSVDTSLSGMYSCRYRTTVEHVSRARLEFSSYKIRILKS
jgi:hypothetical protein